MSEQQTVAASVTVRVNEKPVTLTSHRVSGIQIKEAAIAQGIPIHLDFVLSEELGGSRSRIIGDSDEVGVSDHTEFLAIPPDDNS